MADALFQELRKKIDQYGHGFASTDSGVEIRILKKLFTEEEAQMYLHLSEDLQTAEEIAEKIGKDREQVETLLKQMTQKGHTFPRFPQKDGEPFYFAAAPYVHGLLEHQLHRMDKELAELLEEHFAAGPFSRPGLGLRTIPVQAAVEGTIQISNYDDVKAVLEKKDRIALTQCVCNDWQQTRGSLCNQPKEVCFLFDFYGQYYVDKGQGRWVTPQEAVERLKQCAEAGLVSQFSNTENPEALCNCCPDCCGVLRGLKKIPNAGKVAPSNHFAIIDPDLCSACEICVDRCPMDAISMTQSVARLNREMCIGCGLCVITCPTGALSLKAKSQEDRSIPPEKGLFMRSSMEMEKRFES